MAPLAHWRDTQEETDLNQREGIGLLLHYQAMPSLREVAHDGWFHLLYNSSLKVPSARSWAAPVRATGKVWKRQAVRPVLSQIKTHLLGHSPLSSQVGCLVWPAL